jgi:hypothetical protein
VIGDLQLRCHADEALPITHVRKQRVDVGPHVCDHPKGSIGARQPIISSTIDRNTNPVCRGLRSQCYDRFRQQNIVVGQLISCRDLWSRTS